MPASNIDAARKGRFTCLALAYFSSLENEEEVGEQGV